MRFSQAGGPEHASKWQSEIQCHFFCGRGEEGFVSDGTISDRLRARVAAHDGAVRRNGVYRSLVPLLGQGAEKQHRVTGYYPG